MPWGEIDAVVMYEINLGALQFKVQDFSVYWFIVSITLLSEVRDLKREEVCDLTFAVFVIISCPLYPDSLELTPLLKSASHYST